MTDIRASDDAAELYASMSRGRWVLNVSLTAPAQVRLRHRLNVRYRVVGGWSAFGLATLGRQEAKLGGQLPPRAKYGSPVKFDWDAVTDIQSDVDPDSCSKFVRIFDKADTRSDRWSAGSNHRQ